MKWGGETVGLGIIRYSFMLFYNQKILDNAGVQVPTNFEEFKAAVTNITDVNAGVYGIASATAETSSSLFNEITQYVRWLGGDFVKDGKYSITAPETVAALEEYRQLISKNSALGVDQMMSRQLFLNGSAGFLIDGSWVLPLLDKATPELRPNLKMVALPFEPRSGGIANSLHIPAGISDERKDLVWSFYQKVVSPKWQQQCLLMCGVPVGLETALTEEMRKTHPHLVEIMSAAKGALPMIPIIDKLRAQAREYSTIINRVGVRLVSTQVPTDQIAEEAFGEVQKAIPL
jgi:multiple sugar transport system substrate-binding protein